MKVIGIAALASLLLLGGCTWVRTTPAGEAVRVANHANDIAGCKNLGETTVSLLDKVGYFYRDPNKVKDELAILGSNAAADMGGDTILPVSEIEHGQRTFAVYRCRSY